MRVVVPVLAFAFRLGFFALSALGLYRLFRQEGEDETTHVCIMGSILSLFTSCALSQGSLETVLWLALCFSAILACDVFFARKAGPAGTLFLPVALLTSLGAAVCFDCMADAAGHVKRVVICCGICIASYMVIRRYHHRLASSFGILLVLTLILCALPLIPGLGWVVNGSKAWIHIGSRTCQPSEFAKITLALSLAGYIGANADRLSVVNLRGIIPLLCAFLLSLGTEWMVKDIGTAMIFFLTVAALVVITSRRAGILYTAMAVIGVSVILVFAYHNFEHIASRFSAWLSPEKYESGEQLLAIRAAIANGGLIGTGLNLGWFFYNVPAVDTDAIFSVVAEELGLAGSILVVASVVMLAVQASRIARRLPYGCFERNLINAASVLLCAQAFVIIGGLTRVIPLTGVTLPFVSWGGSSLVSCFALIGFMCAAGSSDKYQGEEAVKSAMIVPLCCSLGLSACLLMCSFIVVSAGGLRPCGLTQHFDVGSVRSSDGTVLAEGSVTDNMVEFDFPQGTLAAHVLGVRSGGIAARISSTAYLTSAVNPIFNLLGIPETVGESQLTIDTRLQAAAEAEIADSTGAVVVLDAKTGAVLAEASNPIYDPSKQYTEDEEGALPEGTFINRAINAHYPPGSTFKMVTAAAGLERGIATPETQLNGNAFVLSNGQRVVNINGIEYGQISLETALKCSSNTAFADLALKMGDDALMEQAEGFGFNKDPDDRVLHTLMSKYGLTQSDFTLAWAAVGQPTSANESVCGPQATVMQMAVVLATIENDGILVKPYILTSEQPKTGFFGGQDRALREGTAQTLHDMLVTSSHVSESRVPVAGKTGTAETGSTNVCWYVCEADGCVVACCIEGTFEYGSTLAMPKALRVLDAAVGLGSYQIN